MVVDGLDSRVPEKQNVGFLSNSSGLQSALCARCIRQTFQLEGDLHSRAPHVFRP